MNMIATLAAAAAVLGAAPAAAPEDGLAAFESAMARGDGVAAAHVAARLVLARRVAPGPPAADPLLNGLIGRLTLSEGEAPQALGFLEHADGPGVPERQRAAARLALAAAREQTGDVDGARAALDSLGGDALTSSERVAATLERGRLLLVSDPAAAIAAVEPLAARDWEAETITAQAQSLLGDRNAARAAADRAWTAAAAAPPQDYAPLRAGLVRAALAAEAGDRPALLAMLNAGAAAGSRVEGEAVASLPVCGEAGVTPTDAVTFTLFEDANGTDEMRPVAATRPSIVRPFVDALAGRNLLAHEGAGPGGTLITVRCRSHPDADYDVPRRKADGWAAWIAQHGLYGEPGRTGSLDDINAVSGEIETMSRTNGDGEPRLIPLRLQLAHWLELRARVEGDVEAWQVAELYRKSAAAIAKLGGAEGTYRNEEDLAAAAAIVAASTPEEGLRLTRAALVRRAGSVALDEAYTQTLAWLAADKDAPNESKRAAIAALLKRFDPKSADPRRRALLIRLGDAQRKDDLKAARASWSAAGLPSDICLTLDDPPHVQEHGITAEDYPADVVKFGIEGETAFDATIGSDGRIAGSRLILSSPSLLFDPAIGARLPGFRLGVPSSAGKARTCRGYIQTVRWTLPDRDDDEEDQGAPPFRVPERAGT